MTANASEKVLLFGFGNPAREDDGLGPAAAEAIEKLEIDGVTVDSNYQLTVEDSAAVAEHDYVVFVDAAVDGAEPFGFARLSPERQESFSSHSVEPEAVLCLSEDLFDAETIGYIVGIRGYSFDMFKETMTKKASENLEKAVIFLESNLRSKSFHQAEQEYENYINKL